MNRSPSLAVLHGDTAVAPVALKQALDQSHEVKAKVETCADALAQVNESTKRTIAAGATTLPARPTLDYTEAVETQVQECAEDMDSVTRTLAQGIEELKEVEAALVTAKAALAETTASVASARASEAQATLRALHDQKTGLPNRALFDDRLAHALALAERHRWTVAVMFLDLDHFKQVNDVHGHAAGDIVLTAIANRLARGAREEDTVCRNGGDEFLCLLVNPQGRENVERIVSSVIQNLAQAICVGAQQLTVRPSIGIAIYPDHGSDADTLIQNADAAMYRAKRIESGFAFHEARVGHG